MRMHRYTGSGADPGFLERGFQGGTSFVDHLCYLCPMFVMLSHDFRGHLLEKG